MKPALQLKLSQQLTMTPQLQQAIKLLQLSSQELESELLEALETNPLLEREENAEDGNGLDESASERDERADGDEGVDSLDDSEAGWDEYYQTMPAPNGSANASRRDSSGPDRTLEIPDRDTEADDLQQHLLWQLNLAHLSARDAAIGVTLVEAINDDGYLTESLESIRQTLAPDIDAETDEIQAVLHAIQRFDPVGVGAGNIRECLLVQLGMLDADTPGLAEAERVIDGHLDLLADQNVSALKRAVGADEDTLRTAIDLVRSLNPRPGSAIPTGDIQYIRPDVIVKKLDGQWRALLYEENMPRLTINDVYARMIGEASKEDASYLRGHLQEARWLLKSLETRNETLLKVAQAIVLHQAEYFEKGDLAMRPLVLREVAEAIEMHESTVSRVTSRKYMLTPRGVLEFKYFFSSQVSTADGDGASATAIQAMIRELVEDEPPAKPLSDSKITRILNDRGIDVARRTVAKYREALNIPSSSQRRRVI